VPLKLGAKQYRILRRNSTHHLVGFRRLRHTAHITIATAFGFINNAQELTSAATSKFAIAAVLYARGFVVNYGRVDTVLGIFLHGPRAFGIAVATPKPPYR
jgi:hypothetical protein